MIAKQVYVASTTLTSYKCQVHVPTALNIKGTVQLTTYPDYKVLGIGADTVPVQHVLVPHPAVSAARRWIVYA